MFSDCLTNSRTTFVHDQIFFAKDCTPCNRLCRMCSVYWSIFRRCISLNKNPTEICQQILQDVPCRGTGNLFVLMLFTRKVQNLAIKENANFTSSAAKSVYKKKKKWRCNVIGLFHTRTKNIVMFVRPIIEQTKVHFKILELLTFSMRRYYNAMLYEFSKWQWPTHV